MGLDVKILSEKNNWVMSANKWQSKKLSVRDEPSGVVHNVNETTSDKETCATLQFKTVGAEKH